MSRSTVALIWLVTLLLAAAGGWRYGAKGAKTECTAEKVAPLVQAIETHNEKAIAGHAVEAAGVKAEARQVAHTEQLIEEARHAPDLSTPAAATCSLDPGRMRLWLAANRGAPVAAPSEPDGPAPGDAAGTGVGKAGRSAGEPHQDGGDVPPPARTVQQPRAVAGDDK